MKQYYWDTCIFIAWLNNEQNVPGLPEGIEEVVNSVEVKKDAILVTSVITFAEMVRCKFVNDGYERFVDLFKRPSIYPCDVSLQIARLAGKLRNDLGTSLKTADSIHLATAIIYQVDELHTGDGSGKKNGLITYSDYIKENYGIVIKMPTTSLPLFQTTKSK